MSERLTTLRARWVIPVSGPPIDGGYVSFRNGRIVAVGSRQSEGEVTDLGDVAIMPGLVNAHTHLEFSDLPAPLGEPGMPLPDWIRTVVARRRAATSGATNAVGSPGSSTPAVAVRQGIEESLRCGVTTIGEIATSDWRAAVGAGPMPLVRMFYELIAARRERVPAALQTAEGFLAATGREGILPGLSPHASYTVHPELLDGLVALAQRQDRQKVPLAMHLAESPEEMELLATGGGPFAQMLRDFDAWEPDGRLRTIGDYLRRLSAAPRAVVVHGNYLSDDDITFLAERRATMSVAYCPRTHSYFGHKPYPLAKLLERGVSMALGTDSRASNPDLDLLAEMRHVHAKHPDISPEQIVALGTGAGARALGLEDQVGTLGPGKAASLAIVELGNSHRDSACEAVLEVGSQVLRSLMH